MLNPELNINKEFKEKVENNLERTFSSTTMTPIKRVLRKETTRVISLLMFHENRKNMMFKVFGSVFYGILDNYVFVHFLCCPQTKLHVYFSGKGFENTT